MFENKSRSIQLEGIFVKNKPKLGRLNMTNLSPVMPATTRNARNSSTLVSPSRSKQLSMSTIPEAIRSNALINTVAIVGPRNKFNNISTRRASEPPELLKRKRVENIETILNRVVRAKCCLANQHPEQHSVIQRAVGDSSADYVRSPGRKAFRIRLKFLQNQFLQDTTEDFMSA